MAGYTREFLIEASLYEFYGIDEAKFQALRKMTEEQYDIQGKDRFRVYTALDADAIRKYKSWLKDYQ